MNNGISYKEDQKWENDLRKAEKIEDEVLLNNKEYKNLIDAHIAINILIKQQVKTCLEIYDRRNEILSQAGTDLMLGDLDRRRGRKILSGWELRNLTK